MEKPKKVRIAVLTMIDPALHHVARVAAAAKKQSMNRWICDSIQAAILNQANAADGQAVSAMLDSLGIARVSP